MLLLLILNRILQFASCSTEVHKEFVWLFSCWKFTYISYWFLPKRPNLFHRPCLLICGSEVGLIDRTNNKVDTGTQIFFVALLWWRDSSEYENDRYLNLQGIMKKGKILSQNGFCVIFGSHYKGKCKNVVCQLEYFIA